MGRVKEMAISQMNEREQAEREAHRRRQEEREQEYIDHTIQMLKKRIDNWTGERTYTLAMMEDIVRCLENGDLLSQVEIDWLNNKI